LSKRTVQERKKKLKDDFKAGRLQISDHELKRQLAAIGALSAPAPAPVKPQLTVAGMFAKAAHKRARAPSPDDVQEIPVSSSKRQRTDLLSPSVALREEEEESSSSDSSPSSDESAIEDERDISPEELEEEAREEEGDAAVDSIVVADDIAEWIDTALDDAAPSEPDALCSLAADCLKTACKNQDYRSTVLFAALVDFYRWMPRMGRLRAALCVAKNHGRGPAFQRVLAA
jgi:hypothetical protein